MPKCYLHIGFNKTGTSSIQGFFYKNKSRLLNEFNILYPDTGLFIGGGIGIHHYLIWSLLESSENFRVNNLKSFEEYIGELKYEIERINPETVVISSEFFFSLNNDSKFEKLNENLYKCFNELYIIVYFRRQDIWIESTYSQKVKNWESQYKKNFKSIVEWVEKNLWLVQYDNFLERWKLHFSQAKIIPRIYDRKCLSAGNVILDFLSILGIDTIEADATKIEVNPSLSVLSTLVKRQINERFNLIKIEHEKLIQYLLKLDKEEGSPIKTFFTLPERIEFLEHFRESNERFFRDWFNSENRFVLSEEEIKFYEEQDRIPREEIEKLVEDRYRKVLGYLMEEKITPKVKVFIQKPKIEYYPIEEVEFMGVDVLQIDLLKEGKLNIGGLVLLKKDLEGDYRLILKNGEEEREIQWKLASPGLALKYSDNPRAKKARFFIEGVLPNKGKPLEIYLRKEDLDKLIMRVYNK